MKKLFLVIALLGFLAPVFAREIHIGAVYYDYGSEDFWLTGCDIVPVEICPVDKNTCKMTFFLNDDKFLRFTEYLKIGACVTIGGLEYEVKSFDYNFIKLECNSKK